MSVVDQVKHDIEKIRKFRIPAKWIPLLITLSAAFFYFLDRYSLMELGIPFGMILSVFCLAILGKRDLWKNFGFWTAMLVIGIGHIMALIHLPWPSVWYPAAVSAIFSIFDLYIILFIIDFLFRTKKG